MPGCRLSQHQERLPIHWWQCYMAFPIYGLALPISSLIDCKVRPHPPPPAAAAVHTGAGATTTPPPSPTHPTPPHSSC